MSLTTAGSKPVLRLYLTALLFLQQLSLSKVFRYTGPRHWLDEGIGVVSHAEATRLLALTASGSGIRAASGAQPNRPVWYRDADIAAAGQSAAAAAALGGTEMAGVEATGTDAPASGDAAGGASSDAKRKRTAGTYGGAAM